MKGILVKTDGTFEEVNPCGLEDLQSLVGGYIQQLSLLNGCVALINEDARIVGGFSSNSRATQIVFQETGANYDLLGDVLFLSQVEDEYADISSHFLNRYVN